jgi:tetratricopeptide (TPR) repeat protein
MRLVAWVVALLGCVNAFADARIDVLARRAYSDGKAAYERGDYTVAQQKFKESFQLSHEPTLLYNIASALQGLRRPHEAAEALRSYVKLVPSDPDRPQIEARIATLEEEQHMLDVELSRNKPAITQPPPVRTVVIERVGPTPEERRRRTRILAASISVAAVVLAAGAITLGVLLQPKYGTTTTELGSHQATQ